MNMKAKTTKVRKTKWEPENPEKVKTVKAWAMIRNNNLVYRGGILDTLAVFSSRKHAHAFAISLNRKNSEKLDELVIPVEIIYKTP